MCKIKLKNIAIELVFLFILFQSVLLNYTSGFIYNVILYTDELLECIMLIMILVKLFTRPVTLKKIEKYIILCWVLFITVGLLSNVFYPMQSWIYNIIDALICSRFLVYYFWCRLFYNSISTSVIKELACICKICAVVFFALTIHDIFFTPFFQKGEFRYFTETIQLFFNLHSLFAVACFSCSVILIMEMGIKKINNFPYIAMLLFCMFMTLRMKAIASLAVVILLYICIFKFHIISEYVLGLSGLLFAVLLGWEQFSFYYLEHSDFSVRSQLTQNSIMLATNYFPLGTGFATYGSNMARVHYSELYNSLGFNKLPGGTGSFLCDTFWPTVIGQTGWIGTLFFILIITSFILIILNFKNNNLYLYWAGLSVIAYELISSTSETAFFNPTATMLFIALALMVNESNKRTGIKKRNG